MSRKNVEDGMDVATLDVLHEGKKTTENFEKKIYDGCRGVIRTFLRPPFSHIIRGRNLTDNHILLKKTHIKLQKGLETSLFIKGGCQKVRKIISRHAELPSINKKSL